MNKPILGYFEAFIDPKDIKITGEGEDQTHELKFEIKDELIIYPQPWVESNVLIGFDGGHIKLSRELFLKLCEKYEKTYEKDIHHSAVQELMKAVEILPHAETVKHFKSELQRIQNLLDKEREKEA